jgi:hypothetical protein
MEVKKVEKKSAESRIRVLIGEISPSMGKRLVEKIILRKIGSSQILHKSGVERFERCTRMVSP